jgi:ketosteroid isomerase-like protein
MNTREVAEAFTAILKSGDHEGAGARFWSPAIRSVEAMDGPMSVVEGIDAVNAKGAWFYGAHEVHSVTTEGPFVNGDQFSVVFDMDLTERESGHRSQSREVALYTVKDGKIVEERFYY